VKKPFHDPIAPKSKTNGDYPFEFKAPSYDNRTSCSMKAGDDYGIGFKQPVGKEKARPMQSGPIPQQSKCFAPDDVIMNDVEG
jgi:hypothetical protein